MAIKAREEDKRARYLYLQMMALSLQQGKVEEAKYFGSESVRLKKRIDLYDYKQEIEDDAWYDGFNKRWNELNKKTV